MSQESKMKITTTEMHTGGEPLRIVETGYPEVLGDTILDKRRYAKDKLDHLRKLLMYEPRGHYDMYGTIFVQPDHPDADFAVLFMHNEGYSTMCGHAVIALGRYAIDKGLVKNLQSPETEMNIQVPSGLVKATVEYENGKTGNVRFSTVPAFAFALDVEVDVPKYGKITLDIGYGGAFYALVPAEKVSLDVRKSRMVDLVEAADTVSSAVKKQIKLTHPDSPDLGFLYGTILTDGQDDFSEKPTYNTCVFADREVDRSPTGSGVTARVAVQFAKGKISLGDTRTFRAGATGSTMYGKPMKTTNCGNFDAVIAEVSGRGYYTGSATFTLEDDDEFQTGFLVH